MLTLSQLACGAGGADGDPAGGRDRQSPAPASTTTPRGLTISATCEAFISIISDLRLSDVQLANELNRLAMRTASGQLAGALRAIASQLEQGAADIPTTEVNRYCL